MTDKEVEVFRKICKELNKNSSYGCQPTIALYKYDDCKIKIYEDITYVYPYIAEDLLKKEG